MGSLTFVNQDKNYSDRDIRNAMVQSHVLSILDYCNTFWGTPNLTELNDIQKVIDGKAEIYDHVTPNLKYLKWLTIKDQMTHDTRVAIF